MRFPNRLASSIMGNTGRLHDYKRNGTTTLFAALNVAEGKIIGRCMRKHRHQERLGFLKVLEAETPAELDPHLIVDNYATHNSPVKKSSRRATLRQHRLSACFRACAARPKNRPAADFSSSGTMIRLFNRADKHAKVMKWLKKHPRFHMHFTPTSSSWLNPVERWFRELTEKCILRGFL